MEFKQCQSQGDNKIKIRRVLGPVHFNGCKLKLTIKCHCLKEVVALIMRYVWGRWHCLYAVKLCLSFQYSDSDGAHCKSTYPNKTLFGVNNLIYYSCSERQRQVDNNKKKNLTFLYINISMDKNSATSSFC